MKQLIRLTILLCACAALALTVVAGPEPLPSGKEMKQVAPAPLPECNWTGFYIGLNVGGQWGHAEDKDLDDYLQSPGPIGWGYDESGVVAGGQVGYNFQWNWLVLGVEGDLGYMNMDGSGTSKWSVRTNGGDTHGESDSDFFTTIRGRFGIALGHWLFYATGGGIGVNWETRVVDDCDVFPCGGALLDAHKEEFNWGWTGGGGIEYMFGCHWTLKAEYLRYRLNDQTFSAEETSGGRLGIPFGFRADAEGNIFRGGLNYKF
jgi:outer membrane immunogenic protein